MLTSFGLDFFWKEDGGLANLLVKVNFYEFSADMIGFLSGFLFNKQFFRNFWTNLFFELLSILN